MFIISTSDIAGYKMVQTLGLVRGSTVRARNVGRDILANFRNIAGGELVEYTRLQADSREQALQRMIADAQALGADAIIGVRFMTSTITQGAAEVLVYGTAVKLQKA